MDFVWLINALNSPQIARISQQCAILKCLLIPRLKIKGSKTAIGLSPKGGPLVQRDVYEKLLLRRAPPSNKPLMT